MNTKMNKTVMAVIAAAIMMSTVLGAVALGSERVAADPPEVVDTGTSGDIDWTLTDDGVLTLSGTGSMANYLHHYDTPWYPYRGDIIALVVEDGVGNIGDNTFYSLSQPHYGFTELILPSSVINIGQTAFMNCKSLVSVIGYGVTSIENYAFVACQSLLDVTFLGEDLAMGSQVFAQCYFLESISVPAMMNMGPDSFFSTDLRTVVINSSNSYITLPNQFIGPAGHFYIDWVFPGQLPSQPVRTLIIDTVDVVDLSYVTPVAGKVLSLTGTATATMGGTLYDSDGVTELIGLDRADHIYTAQSGAWVAAAGPVVPGPDPDPEDTGRTLPPLWVLCIIVLFLLCIGYAIGHARRGKKK